MIDTDCIRDVSYLLHVPDQVKQRLLEAIRSKANLSPSQLREDVLEYWPELALFGSETLRHLRYRGYLLVRNFPFGELNPDMRRQIFLALTAVCGVPVSHVPGKEEYVWEVTTKDVHRRIPTYSEHNLEAPLHTDSQYRENPEEFVAFLLEKPAMCGGGRMILLRADRIFKKLEESEEGRRTFAILRDKEFPSSVPSVYDDSCAYVTAPIITKDGKIRFRQDTIEIGMELAPRFKTSEREQALSFFSQLVNRSSDRLSATLEKGEMIFINNRTVLHGRTAFDDKSRLLLRIRFNSPARA